MSLPEKWIQIRGMTALNVPHLDSENAESREDCVRKDLTLRLKRVCENLSTADFAALVVRMTRNS